MKRQRRSLADRFGVYRREGRIVFGRAPYISEDEWKLAENPGPVVRALQRLGLVYSPDRTRPRRPLGRTTD